MSDRYFVDTNILMYAHDSAAGAKHERDLIETLWREWSGVLSTQVLQEFSVNLRRKTARPVDARMVREIIKNYLSWRIVVNEGESILGALELEERYQISFWDALVVHSAQTAGAGVLYSEDLSDGQLYGSVRVVNPLGEKQRADRDSHS